MVRGRRTESTNPLWQDRTSDHAGHSSYQAENLWRPDTVFGPEGFADDPGKKAGKNSKQSTLCGGALPVKAGDQRYKSNDERDFVGMLDHLEDRGIAGECHGEHHAGKRDDDDTHQPEEDTVRDVRQHGAQNVFGKRH